MKLCMKQLYLSLPIIPFIINKEDNEVFRILSSWIIHSSHLLSVSMTMLKPAWWYISAGLSYDWDREFSTTDPEYYKWTQWIFLQLHKRGLAYQAEVPVNWCPELGTVLANEEVIDGKSERGGFPVVRMPMRQVQRLLYSAVLQPYKSYTIVL